MRIFSSIVLLITLNLPNVLAIHHYILSDSHFACSYSEQHIHEKVDDCVVDNFITNSIDFDLTDDFVFDNPSSEDFTILTFYKSFHTYQAFYNYSLRGPPVI